MDLNYSNKIVNLKCSIVIRSKLNILDLGRKISESIFGDIPFEGLEANIYNEVPAVFFRKSLLGLEVTLFGFPVGIENGHYYLEINSHHLLGYENEIDVDLSYYVMCLLKKQLGVSVGDIFVFDPNQS